MLDWVIRGGTVIDGSGGAPFRADIGICGGKIAVDHIVANRKVK